MRHLLMYVALATVITPVQAQVPSAAVAPPVAVTPPQSPPAAYSGSTYQSYPFPAPTPEDAYRAGIINRWEYEQYAGPLPQALQGPSVDGTRGGNGGEGGRQ